VVFLRADEFLSTDGSRGLRRWSWRSGPNELAKLEKTIELPARLIAAPVVLPGDGGSRVCVADVQGTVHLLQSSDGKLLRRWSLPGRITAGPFLRGQHLGVIVDHSHLVWLDPERAAEAWHYETEGTGIVGQPQLVGGLLLVADQSGHFVAIDPATGKRQGSGYRLTANVAPAAAPIAFGPQEAFAPLTDGTVLMLSLQHFCKAPK
jgi:outer membrane protein assembly factor BamB